MKNICFILISLCISLSSFAQTDAQHLKFKGVPIDGTLAAYVSKMKAAGFSDLGIKDGTAVLQGDFAGFKGCIIGVSTLKTTNVVNTIGVIFPECDNWSKLEIITKRSRKCSFRNTGSQLIVWKNFKVIVNQMTTV